MCYFLTIGCRGEPWQVVSLLEDEALLPLEASPAPPSIVSAFPADDVVRLLTHRGCSCDLLARAGQKVVLTSWFRQRLATAAARLGTLRFCIRTQLDRHAEPVKGLTLKVDELLQPADELPTDTLVCVSAGSQSE